MALRRCDSCQEQRKPELAMQTLRFTRCTSVLSIYVII